MRGIPSLWQDFLHLFYPHHCCGCGIDLPEMEQLICLRCMHELPVTHFAGLTDNPTERLFTGRLPVTAACSYLYFNKEGLAQRLVHELKYKGNKAIGQWLGEQMGRELLVSGRFTGIDYILPVPLSAAKEHGRGYNQSAVVCAGINTILSVPVCTGNLTRHRATATQTHKHREERWENVSGSFTVLQPAVFEYKHLLLVDDVITTGATLDACGQVLLAIPGVRLSIATLACA